MRANAHRRSLSDKKKKKKKKKKVGETNFQSLFLALRFSLSLSLSKVALSRRFKLFAVMSGIVRVSGITRGNTALLYISSLCWCWC